MVAEIVGFAGEIGTDPDEPDGTSRKVLDVGKLSGLGWKARTELKTGIAEAYRSFLGLPGA